MFGRLLDQLRRGPAAPPAVRPPFDAGPVVRAAREAAQRGDATDAERLLQAAIAEHGNHAALLFTLGRVRLIAGALEGARGALEASRDASTDPGSRDRARLFHALAQARIDVAGGRSATAVPLPEAPLPRISVVVPSVTPTKFASLTRNLAERLHGLDHEVIGIHDGRSMAEALNRGIARARGELVVLCHDDVHLASADFAPRLVRHLREFDVVGIAGTSRLVAPAWVTAGPPEIHGQVGYPLGGERTNVVVFGLDAPARHGIQALDGCFVAARREVLESVRFDEAAFQGWHLYDVDFSYSAWQAGWSVAVGEDLLVVHTSPGGYDAAWQRAAQVFREKHRTAIPDPAQIAPVAVETLPIESFREWALLTERLTA